MRAARFLPLALAAALAACGGGQRVSPATGLNTTPPGPEGDPWGPYIREAATRFSIPDRWIREVMRQESGGHEVLHGHLVTSDAGAMGLMQIMPATYEMLRAEYRLGDDPYDPHDNIVAGAGYIRELYDKYGAPGFLAAYNAGPQRLEDYNAGRSPLPHETVDYVASIAPRLGTERPLTGPLAAYADGGPVEVASAAPAPPAPPVRLAAAGTAPRCWHDPDRAYDPDAPCETPPAAPAPAPTQVAAAVATAAPIAPAAASLPPPLPYGAPPPATPAIAVAQAAPPPSWSSQADHPRVPTMPPNCWHDPDRAYDPTAPCETPPAAAPAPIQVAAAPSPPRPATPKIQLASVTAPGAILWSRALQVSPPAAAAHHFALIPAAYAADIRPSPRDLRWGIQLGAYATPTRAEAAAESARTLTASLAATRPSIGHTSPFGGHTLYRARLIGLTSTAAAAACRTLERHNNPCVEVPPGG